MSEVKPCRCEYCEYRDMKHHNFPCNGCLTITNDGVADLFHPRTKSTIADSGNRREFASGAVRDMAEGKGRCDLMALDVAAKLLDSIVLRKISEYTCAVNVSPLYEAIIEFSHEQNVDLYSMMLSVARHFEEGAKKYTPNNWKRGISTHSYIDSAVRHYLKHKRGDKDEPHDAAFVWNLMCCIWTVKNKPEMIDYPWEKL